MAKSKISSDDFLSFLVEDEEPRNLAFHPQDSFSQIKSQNSTESIKNTPDEKSKTNSTENLRTTTGNSTDASTEILRKQGDRGPNVKSTENLRTTTGKSTDLKIGDGNSTEGKAENLRKTTGNQRVPSDRPILRTTTGNSTDASTEILRKQKKRTLIKPKANFQEIACPPKLNQLVGFQRAVFFWIAGEAKKFGQNDPSGNRTTPQINGQIMASKINKPYKSAKDLVYELTVKKYLHRVSDYKTGQNGYSQYLIERDLYQEWIHAEALENFDHLLSRLERKFYGNSTDASTDNLRKTTGNQVALEEPNILRKTTGNSTDLSTDTRSSMYVGNINNTIHTEPTPSVSIEPDTWDELRLVDFAPLGQWGIKSAVVEILKKNKWTIERVQLEDFIEQFVRYFTEPEYEQRRAAVKNPYSIFLNCIKSLAKGEPHAISDVPTDFEIQTKIAEKNLLARQQEQKKRLEEIEKLKQELVETSFQGWISALTIEEQLKLVPSQPMAKPGSIAHKQLLKDYYIKHICPNKEHNDLNGPRA
jgi:hypothetical protein